MNYWLRRLLVVLMGIPMAQVCSASTTVPAGIRLASTFESISVRAPFTGDLNRNNSATVQFRPQGSSQWLDAYEPFIDRRPVIVSIFGTNDNWANVNQARVSIVGLRPTTDYEVRITWTDPDGVVGGPAVTGVTRTLSYSVPTNGVERIVDGSVASEGNGTVASPYRTISTGLQNANPGDTIRVRNGSYAPLSLNKSGAAGNWIVIKAEPGHSPLIQGGAANQCVYVAANYVVLDGLHFERSQLHSVEIQSLCHDIFVQNTVSTNVCANSNPLANWGAAGVRLNSGSSNIYILTNRIQTAHWTTPDENIYGIFINGTSNRNLVISDNQITGTFWDAFGNGGNKAGCGPVENCDVSRNAFHYYNDDSAELEGDCVNVRFWENTILSTNSYSLLGLSGVYVGPCYIFRNVFTSVSSKIIGFKAGDYPGPMYLFHNVADTTSAPGSGHEVFSGGTNMVACNNILLANGNVYYRGRDGNKLDYNLLYNNPGAYIVDAWNPDSQRLAFETIQSFSTATGQEIHGIQASPLFEGSTRQLSSSSPAIDKGIVIPNFNDGNSKWPFSGLSPDLGVFERDDGSARPQPPTGLRVVASP